MLRSLNGWKLISLTCLALAIAFGIAVGRDSWEHHRGMQRNKAIEKEKTPEGLDDHGPLLMVSDSLGLVAPPLTRIAESNLPDNLVVIGVSVGDQSIAFTKDALKSPHIVNTVLGQTPISVTYCALVNCVRVLTGEDKQPLPLRLGGQDENLQLVLMYKKHRYSQESKKIPLQDVMFSETSLGEWAALHPDSKLFSGVEHAGAAM